MKQTLNTVVVIPLIIIVAFISSCTVKDQALLSPSKVLEANLENTENGPVLKVKKDNELLLNIDLARFIFEGDSKPVVYTAKGSQPAAINNTWKPVYGERSEILDHYNAIDFTLTPTDGESKNMKIECRVYDEGVAFRYVFDKATFKNQVVNEELTTFNFNEDFETWITEKWKNIDGIMENNSQSAYFKIKLSEMGDNLGERPQIVKRNSQSYIAIGEAALVDYARMRFVKSPGSLPGLQTKIDGKVDLETAGYVTPWRYVMVANSPGQLLENNFMVLNLNEPNSLKDVSWIKPGKVIREVTLTTKGGMACVDFAARHNLQYIEFDAGWYGHEYSDGSDATTITVDPGRSPGPLDLHEVIKYAEEKGVGVILYVNRRQLETQLDEILPLYKSWGVKGIKYGFVHTGPQTWTSWLHEAVRKAAKYNIMVDVHDEYRPTGYSRTFPNFMSAEGIMGDESTPSIENDLVTLFARMIAGAGDHTICYYAPRVSEKMGGKAAQMAKAIMLYSPWQFLYWYDRPVGSPVSKGGAGAAVGIIDETEDHSLFDELPTVWDDTKVLEGEIGEYATIARKNGNNWFLGSLVANTEREVNIPLDFLDADVEYEAVIYSQDATDLENEVVNVQKTVVSKGKLISKHLLKDTGFALVIKKK